MTFINEQTDLNRTYDAKFEEVQQLLEQLQLNANNIPALKPQSVRESSDKDIVKIESRKGTPLRIQVENVDQAEAGHGAGTTMDENQIREMIDEVVTAKLKMQDVEVSDVEEFETGDEFVKKQLSLLNRKIKTTKRVMQGFRIDFSEWQTQVMENKRKTNLLQQQVSKLEEIKDELDLSEISVRAQVSTGEVVKTMQTMQ